MSGGDLDGDTYFVAWDKELISYIDPKIIKEPADYSKSELVKEKPDADNLEDYFTFYLQRDVLGTVSNLWLMLSDKYGQDGPCDPKCISLSHMCSVAVDFAKHGECVSQKNYE
jgi:RNA-dependent RNA polymerase